MGVLEGYGGSIASSAIGMGVQTALNIGSGFVNQIFAKRNAKIQQNYNRQLMDYQNELQQQNIDKQNAYNSPVEQMKRYTDAGLNPNLIYGQASSGNQSSVPKVSSPAPANFQNIQSPFENMLQGIQVIDSLVRLRDNMNKTRESAARAELLDTQNLFERWKMFNLAPHHRRELILRNLGLGYDNTIKYERSLHAKDFVDSELRYQTNLADKMWSDSMLSYYGMSTYPTRWKFEKRALWLANEKERQAINNMMWQNRMQRLNYDFEKWSLPLLKKQGIIPGVTSSTTSTSSHSLNVMGIGGSGYQSGTYSGPIRFKNF